VVLMSDARASQIGDDIRRIHEKDITDDQVKAVLEAIEGHGGEIAAYGTTAALKAVSERCPDCIGVGTFQDDSHPGNATHVCETCGGHRVVPAGAELRSAGMSCDECGATLPYDALGDGPRSEHAESCSLHVPPRTENTGS
jgi:hypothetical protein